MRGYFYNEMRYINLRFTYFTYLLSYGEPEKMTGKRKSPSTPHPSKNRKIIRTASRLLGYGLAG